MAIETNVTLICDRCGSRHDKAKYHEGNSWAQCKVIWSGDKGGRTWMGDAGGIELRGDVWLCGKCTDEFIEFIQPRQAP